MVKPFAQAQTIGGQTLENAENYRKIMKINYTIMQNPDSANFIISTNIKQLQLIADGEGKQAGIARYMLYNYNKEQFANYKQAYLLPNTNKSSAFVLNKPSENYTSEKSDAVFVYPNPCDGQLNVEYINIENASNINIYDIQGKIVITFNATPKFGFQTIDVSSLQKGTYLIGFGKGLTTQFVVK